MKSKFNKFLTLLAVLLFGVGSVWGATESISWGITTNAFTLTPTITPTEGAHLSNASTSISLAGLSSTSSSKSGYSKPFYGSTEAFNDSKYASISFVVAEGYTFTPSSLDMTIFSYGTGNLKYRVIISDSKSHSITSEDIKPASGGEAAISFSDLSTKLEGTVTIKLFLFNYNNTSSGKRSYIKSPIAISGTIEEAGGGGDPVDPVFTYTASTYTIGDPALDLSTKLSSTNTVGAITFAVSTSDAGTTGASIASDKNFTATTAGTATITVSQAASTGYNAHSEDITVTVVEPDPCTTYFHFVATADATANGKTNWDGFTSAPTGSNGQSNSVTIDGTTYTLTKRTGSTGGGGTILGFTIPANKAGTLYGYMKSSGTAARVLSLKKGDDVVMTNDEIGTGGNWTLITMSNIAPGTYTLSPDQNVQVQMFALKVCDATFRTITLEYADGTTPDGSLSVLDGEAATKPADPTWAHHRFAGWYNGASPYDWASTVSGDITLTAHWTQLYTITYAAGDGTATGDAPTQADKAATETFTVAANPFTVAGKDFVTWNDGANDYAPGATYTVGTDNVILTAQWTTAADKYTVHYMDEDGTTPLGADELVNVGEHPAGITATKPLCTFASWQLSGSDIALSSVSAAKDEEVTLTARWTKAYATSYDMEAYAASVGASKAGLEEELTAAGYAYTNINGIDNGHTHNYTYDGMKYKTNDGDLSFNVVAGKVVEVKTGHLPSNDAVIMNINGVADATVFEGADEDSETHKTNYFYSAVEALYRLDVLASKGTCAVKAVTIRDPFTVSFEAHGDADPSALQGLPYVTLPDATNGTASLLGWFDAETGGNKIGDAGATYIPTANITLHAQWESVSTDARLASITLDPSTGAWSPAFDPEVVNYTYTMPYGTADVPQITGATAVNAGGSYSIISQAAAWGETAVIRGVAASSDTKAYNITMLREPKDGVSIIKVETTGGTNKTVTGLYAGDGDVSLSSSKKMDNGKYIGFILDGTTLQAGDRINVHTTTAANTGGSHIIFYDNMTDKNELYETGEIGGLGDNIFTINAAMVGATTAYVYRSNADAAHQWNGYVDFLEVTRAMNPMLTAITFAGEAGTINESYKTVTVTVPNATDLGSMTVVPTIVRNAPHATTPEAVITNAGAWVEGPNTYRIMDKDGDYTDYTVTITRAALSDDATLSSLTVNGQAVALADGVFDYSFELPYGTSSAPTVVATPHHGTAVATVDPCTLSGATITVVPESGVGDQKVYTLTFTISPWKEVVIWDGSYMTDVETSPDATGLAWAAVGCTGIENWAYATDEPNGKVPAYCSDNDKTYTHVNGSGKNECNIFRTGGNTKNTRYFQITVPAGYVAKFYVVYGSHGEGTELTMSIGTEASATATDGILSLTTDHRYLLSGGMSEVVGAGDYFLNATGSADFFEIRAYLRPGYGRKVSNNIGTLCVDHNVPAGGAQGATFYQIAGKNAEGKLVFEEVTSLNAGEPYVFQSTTGGITLYYGETTAPAPVEVKGMVGSFSDKHVDIDDSNKTNIMYIANNKLWDCSDLTPTPGYLDVVANRAYIFNYAGIGAAPAHAPGKRYIVVGKDQATGFDQLEASEAPMKLIIDGQLFILRGEKMYNANGQLVK